MAELVNVSARRTLMDCGIKGCDRAAYRQDLCRQHYAMLPMRDNMERAVQSMMRQHDEAKRRRRAVVRELQKRLDGTPAT